jgi:geranylgeranyl reductase family protein
MNTCDVLIVGGGPAGSSCAWALRHSGMDVAILDRQVFPRDKVCGGWITLDVVRELEIDPAAYALGRVLQPITSFRVGPIGGSAVEIGYGKPVSYGIRRREFDDYLLRRSGARLLLGSALTHLERIGEDWIANNQIRARVVVGAGGHFCPVARLTGAKPSGESAAESVVVAQEIEFEMDKQQLATCRVSGEMPELYFCHDMKGYGWCFRKGNFLNVGLGRADQHKLSAHVADFVRFLNETGRVSFALPAMHGHAYLLNGTSTRAPAGDGVVLIGDAAGLAYPQSGEGIRPAIESGLLAAKTILDGSALTAYAASVSARPNQNLANLGRYIPSAWVNALARGLLQTHWFVRQIVLNRWFLHPSPGL